MITFNYTTELRVYIENVPPNRNTHLPTRQAIENGRKYLFDFDYPFFDNDYRKIFETNFIRRFYMRQIGFETVGLFKFQLETWLNINMPYFNKLFESELIEFDPLESYSLKTEHRLQVDKQQIDTRESENSRNINAETETNTDRNISGINTETSSSENALNDETTRNTTNSETGTSSVDNEKTHDSFQRKLQSNTPDSRLQISTDNGEGIIEYASSIDEDKLSDQQTDNTTTSNNVENELTETLATNQTTTGSNNVSITTNTDDVSSDNSITSMTGNESTNDQLNSDINTIEEYFENKVGSIGVKTYSEMLQEFRQTFLRIENQIFHEMNELFMLVY